MMIRISTATIRNHRPYAAFGLAYPTEDPIVCVLISVIRVYLLSLSSCQGLVARPGMGLKRRSTERFVFLGNEDGREGCC